MKIPKYARYDYCAIKANEFINKYKLYFFPIEPLKIIQHEKWGLTKYSELMSEYGCDLDTVIRCLKSKDGYTILDENNYSIAYNDLIEANGRITFTLMHEIGHIYLNHLIDFEKTNIYRSDMTNSENDVLEKEANAFTRNVLAPVDVVNSLNNLSKSYISNFFGITEGAAKTRLDLLATDKNNNKITDVNFKLNIFFDEFYRKRHCAICNNALIIKKNVYFCPICGGNSFNEDRSNTMEYDDEYQLDENGKVVEECVTCRNIDLPSGGVFCKICGKPVVNKCTNPTCGRPSDGKSRYCIHCGSETTFFKHELLYPWDYHLSQSSSEFTPSNYEDDDDLPF